MSAGSTAHDRQESRGTKVNVGTWERRVSLIGGGALTLYGLARRTPLTLGLAALGAKLLYRGISGFSPTYKVFGINTAGGGQGRSPVASVEHRQGVKIVRAVTINRSVEELFRFWRNFENLPRFMNHLEAVTVLDDKRSHWVVKGPAGKSVEWDAEIINEVPNELIGWRSLPGASIGNAGSVRFTPTPGGRGSEVKVTLEYDPPAGWLGTVVAKIFDEEPDQQVLDDLRRFKNMMEAGEMPTTPRKTAEDTERNQPTGAAHQDAGAQSEPNAEASPLDVVQRSSLTTGPLDVVQQASEESFPASDPPTWNQDPR